MKNLILFLCISAILFAYPVNAQVSQANLTNQLEVLRQELIKQLIDQIAMLQKQIAEILASQTTKETSDFEVKCKGEYLDYAKLYLWTATVTGKNTNLEYAFVGPKNKCGVGFSPDGINTVTGVPCEFQNGNEYTNTFTDYVSRVVIGKTYNAYNIDLPLSMTIYVRSGNTIKQATCMGIKI